MLKIASASGAPPQTPQGSLRLSPRPSSREGLLAFGNRSFAPFLTRTLCYVPQLLDLILSSPWLLTQFLYPPPYMPYVELINCGYLCRLCPHPIYVPLTKKSEISPNSVLLSPKAIYRFTPLSRALSRVTEALGRSTSSGGERERESERESERERQKDRDRDRDRQRQ